MIKVKTNVTLRRRGGTKNADYPGRKPKPDPLGRTPRVSKLLALAIHFDSLLRTGKVSDQGELARLGMVTQPRITQILNLLHLAPDIQEQLLFLPRVHKGRDPIHEKMLRPVVAHIAWSRQRELWSALTNGSVPDLTQ